MRLTTGLVCSAVVLAFPAVGTAQDNGKVWIDVNVGIAQPAESALTVVAAPTLHLETATFGTDYKFSRGADFDFGGGYMVTPKFGLGLSVVGTASEDPADLFITIPHPFVFNRLASDSGTTSEFLERTEGTVNFQAVGVPINTDRLMVRLYGGPSYFRLKGDAVSSIAYEQFFLGALNAVEISSYESESIEDTGWGFHTGADLGVFFTRRFGVGAFVRYSRGTVTVGDEQLLTDAPVDVKVGGFQTGGGLRLRF
jgi:hypothetical protein